MTKTIIEQNQWGSLLSVPVSSYASHLIIEHELANARISLHGGHVLSWQPQGHEEVLWLSDTASYDKSKAIRGGIPLCWPWFGPLAGSALEPALKALDTPDDNIDKAIIGAANHGFARTSLWQLTDHIIEQDKVILTLSLSGQQHANAWPFAYQLTQQLIISSSLQQSLRVTNTGTKAFAFNGALHSYFRVSNPENVAIPILNDAFYDDKLVAKSHCSPSDVVQCSGPIDKIYHCDKAAVMTDKHWQRAIKVSKTGCPQWVLWNPGRETAANMADIHSDGEQQFVCLEAANTEFIDVAAGTSAEIAQHIQVYKL